MEQATRPHALARALPGSRPWRTVNFAADRAEKFPDYQPRLP